MANTYNLKAWTKPGTTETRIYIDGGRVVRGDKLYIFAAQQLGRESWDAKLFINDGNAISYSSRGLTGGRYDIGLAIAEEALKERGLDRASFSEILAFLA